jgi:hypothetical protein
MYNNFLNCDVYFSTGKVIGKKRKKKKREANKEE